MSGQVTVTASGVRPYAVAGSPLLCDAREHGLTGDGTTNDQPALAALVDQLGDAFAADGRARVIYCPPGVYAIRDAGTVWRSGVSLMGAGPGATRFTNCVAVGNATIGIFLEMHYPDRLQPRGMRIANCHAESNRFGISDWGADGLIVTGCTMTGNLEAGFQVSAKGTTGVPGKGGLLTNCVIDGNLRDGVNIGNTVGPYTVRGNRITGNGRHGYHHQDLGDGDRAAAEEIVIESNDIWGNSRDGIRFDRPLRDAVIINNRIRNNGSQCTPAASGGGESVRYTRNTVIDQSADWPADGHRGKVLRVGHRYAVVAANDATTLTLAPIRPDDASNWSADTPPPGTPYELPAAPAARAGITVNATADSVTIRGNLIRDSGSATQTHGIWVTDRGNCADCRVLDNDLDGNGTSIRADVPADGGRWSGNHGHQS
ncbi:right-handed parallel beta-helix repeat-containing protein [Micromonospora sp. NPDC000442]|uniref:right-handed parallel beta-helix repeat-containing protein n=1 Tax=Micromonospora sp. NPDC000442 TaxID=3364217 RepID=UPI0036C83922